jgi:hypothetical protein
LPTTPATALAGVSRGRHARHDPGVVLLGKPYRKADLARMVRLALD